MESIDSILYYIQVQDGDGLAHVLSDGGNSRNVSTLPEKLPNIPNGVESIVENYILLNKTLTTYDLVEQFKSTLSLLKSLNRFAEGQTQWIIKPLISLTKNLIIRAKFADEFIAKNPNYLKNGNDFNNSIEQESSLIQSARVIHNSFKLCLNDKNENLSTSRRSQIYFFVGQELKIYFNLQNRELGKNMEKVLISKKNELPDLNKIYKSHSIEYLYYSGAISCGDGDFENAYYKFLKAFQLCSKNDSKHKDLILVYLVPLKFLITRKLPDLVQLRKFPRIYNLYLELIQSIEFGDLKKFETFVDNHELFLLKKNLYLVIEKLNYFILLKLIKKIYQFNDSNSLLNLNLINRGIEFSKFHTNNIKNAQNDSFIGKFSSDQSECLIANLIYKGYIKGYISHTNGVLVLSKKEAFPKQVIEG